jgi:hypothetical protein
MSKEYVMYNGVRMAKEWPAKIEESQKQLTYVINGKEHSRIRYGDEEEDWGADKQACHDCGVIKGQFHVAQLCDVERCPTCGCQAIGCDCHYDGDSES